MDNNYSTVARIRDAKATITWSGQTTNTVWEVLSFSPSLEAQKAEEMDGNARVAQVGTSGQAQVAQVTVIGRAGSGGNTLANALLALNLPEIMTVMTVTSGGSLSTDDVGTWNLFEVGKKYEAGKYVLIDITLKRWYNGSTYASMSAAA